MYVSSAALATPGMTKGKCNENAKIAGGSSSVNAMAERLFVPVFFALEDSESVLMSVVVRSRQSCGFGKVAHMLRIDL